MGEARRNNAVEIVSILASGGGLVSLSEMLAHIPKNFPVPILYQQPVLPSRSHELWASITRNTDLHVSWLRDGQRLKAGHLYLCPGTSWVVVDKGIASLIPLSGEGRSQPAVELAGSLIASYHSGCVLVVLKEVEMTRGAALLHRFERRGIILSESAHGHFAPGGPFGLVLPLREVVPSLLGLMSSSDPIDDVMVELPKPKITRKASDLREFLHELVSLALRLHDTGMTTVQLYDGEKGTLHIAAQCGFAPGFLRYLWIVSSGDTSACGRAVRERRTVAIANIYRDHGYSPHISIAEAAGYMAVQATPLICRSGRLVGVLSTYFNKAKRLTRGQIRILNIYARLAADVIERLTLHRNHGQKFAATG